MMVKMMLTQVRDSYTPQMGKDAADALRAAAPDDVPMVAQVLRDVLAELDQAPGRLEIVT
jgi:hypothetical protein